MRIRPDRQDRMLARFCLGFVLVMIVVVPVAQPVYLNGYSMVPSAGSGSIGLCIYHGQYEVGDVVSFGEVAHRIVNETENGYITKGDFNDDVDAGTLTDEDIRCEVYYITDGGLDENPRNLAVSTTIPEYVNTSNITVSAYVRYVVDPGIAPDYPGVCARKVVTNNTRYRLGELSTSFVQDNPETAERYLSRHPELREECGVLATDINIYMVIE